MSTKKQKERKKKQREEKAKSRVFSRRKAMRKISSEEKQASRLERKFRTKQKPFVKDQLKREAMEKINNEKILSKLEKNAEILRALESEYEKELENKKTINEKLESEGHLTLEEKMSALEKKVKDNMTESQINSGTIDMSESEEKI
jgi:membrane carboxypeptidase/penicillin-binding protein PbpC